MLVPDANACPQGSGTITVYEPDSLIIAVDSLIHISCNGADDGAIYVTTTGGNPGGYTYAWTGAGVSDPTDEDQTGLSMGGYETIVTDIMGCKDTLDTQVIMEPDPIVITNDSINHVSCFGGNDGYIYVNVDDGTPSYSYAWSGPGTFPTTSKDITGLVAGTFTLTVTDSRGCQEVHVVNITQPLLLEITNITPADITCNGADDGEIDITFTGGTAPHSFAWSGPGAPHPNTKDLTNLEPGDYKLTITDNKSCQDTSGTITLIEPDSLLISIDSVIHISCNAQIDGAIYVTTTGGNPVYTYDWTGGNSVQTAKDQTGLSQADCPFQRGVSAAP